MLQTAAAAAAVHSSVVPVDPLLKQCESEYHYLFNRVHQEAQRKTPATSLEEHSPLPNVA